MSKNTVQMVIALAIGVVCGSLFFNHHVEKSANAMTAHGTDKKTMVTVPLDDGMEAVVTLDHTTGDMMGYVIHRVSGQFFVRYRYNVSQDFPQHRGGFLMAAGFAQFRGFRENNRVANGLIYVSEENSGRLVAYAMPWNPRLSTSIAEPQELQFLPLDQAQTRFTMLRDN